MKKTLTMLNKPEKYFSDLISMIVFLESEDRDNECWEIIHSIEDLPNEAELLMEDFIGRNLENEEECILYSYLWASLFNTPEYDGKILKIVNDLSEYDKQRFFKYVKDILLSDLDNEHTLAVRLKDFMSHIV